ncbi:M15 family metallopeptidase [Gulosibacter hominis]|uniref:M15 family metallopeptidase n=1 Tax=Gulosibacter hominis TaxID=2770504 RepID=UPI0019194175|nr:M15 family metallopeptidase [Gulosibacter hominis]
MADFEKLETADEATHSHSAHEIAVAVSERKRARRKQGIGLAIAVVVACAAVGGTGVALAGVSGQHDAITVVAPSGTSTPTATPTPISAPTSTRAQPNGSAQGLQIDIDDPNSITTLVNKQRPLPKDFVPKNLVKLSSVGVPSVNDHSMRREAADASRELYDAAGKAGYHLNFASGYRSYELQTELYTEYVEQLGQEAADATSAKPGFSEHQTGLAVDIFETSTDCILEGCFGETKPGKWLKENSWKYGFILRYENGTQDVVGYEYEPWHFRYVGKDVAAAYHESGARTYEEFVGAPAAPDYKKP